MNRQVATSSSHEIGNYCRFNGRIIERPGELGPPTALTKYVHDGFRALVLNEQFPCVGARAAIRQNAYAFALYEQMRSANAASELAADLERFIDDETLRKQPLTSFVASFVEPVRDEAEFEAMLWTTLELLNGADSEPWALHHSANPDAPDFSFSFQGTSFFIVGLHGASSRTSRRFAWPTLVFNPHDQFDRMRENGSYPRFQRVIRAGELALQGSVNPMLSDFGERSEARQYSGRRVEEGWRCPFHARSIDSSKDGR